MVWSDFFTDALTGRNVTSACLPVYNPSTVESAPQLLGVTCVDVDPLRYDDFSDVATFEPTLVGPHSQSVPTKLSVLSLSPKDKHFLQVEMTYDAIQGNEWVVRGGRILGDIPLGTTG